MIRDVLQEIGERINLSEATVLETYAREGDWHTAIHYASMVKHITAWEINPEFEQGLRATIPTAAIAITDSCKEIHRTQKKFDIVIMDNFLAHGSGVEHFCLFPGVYRVLKERAYIVRNIFLNPYLYRAEIDDSVKEARKAFYHTDSEIISLAVVQERYRGLARENGFYVTWDCVTKRTEALDWYTEELKKAG